MMDPSVGIDVGCGLPLMSSGAAHPRRPDQSGENEPSERRMGPADAQTAVVEFEDRRRGLEGQSETYWQKTRRFVGFIVTVRMCDVISVLFR